MKAGKDDGLVPRAPALARARAILSLLARCDHKILAVIAALVLLNSVAGAAQSLSLKWLVDGAIEHRVDFAIVAAVVGGIASGVLGVASRTAGNLQDWVATVTGVEISRETLESTARMPGIEHLERSEYLDQVSMINRAGTSFVRSIFAFGDFISLAIRISIIMWLLASVQPLLMLLPLFILPSVALVPSTQKMTERAEERAAEPARASDSLHRAFFDPAVAMEIRLFDCGRALDKRADELWREMARIKLAGAAKADAIAAIGWAAIGIGYVLALLLVITEAAHGRATAGDVVLVSALALQLRSNVALTMGSFRQGLTALRLADRSIWLRDQAAEQERRWGGKRPAPNRLDRGIAIESLSFTYPGNQVPALTDIELFMPAGTTVAVVGENGSGKTTLVKMLCRLYQPTSGRICVDDIELSELDVREWRSRISGCFQDFVRLETRAKWSVGAGDPPAMDDEDRVWSAIRRADLSRLTEALPAGLETHLGRSFMAGTELSGGEWQKVAIARGLMRLTPLLLVLDEPTAALDPSAEAVIYERYIEETGSSRSNGGITVVVSHRLSSVRKVDLIVVMHKGHIVEIGAHDALIALDGRYATMFKEQAAAYRLFHRPPCL